MIDLSKVEFTVSESKEGDKIVTGGIVLHETTTITRCLPECYREQVEKEVRRNIKHMIWATAYKEIAPMIVELKSKAIIGSGRDPMLQHEICRLADKITEALTPKNL